MADRIKNYQQEADQITTLKAIRTDFGVTPSSYTPDATVVTKDRVVTFAQAEEELVVLSDIEKGVKQQIVDVDIAQKDISNIKALLQGHLYDYQTDSTSAYTKTVPSGAMPYAGLEQIGGKTVVWNQMVDSGTTTVSTISGHKYYTLINGTASIVTSDGSAISIVDDTADMVCDLTLMFGSGNEPATTSDFTAIFGATHYSYNAGELLSAGVTEVDSYGYNHLNETYMQSHYTYTDGVYYGNVNMFYSDYNNTINQTYKPNTSYYVTCDLMPAGSAMDVRWAIEYTDGTYTESNRSNVAMQYTTISITTDPTKTVSSILFALFNGGNIYAKNIIIREANPLQTYPIPTAIRNLEGYGWSAGSVYNYVDFERKVFVQNVGRVDMGELAYDVNTLLAGCDRYCVIIQNSVSKDSASVTNAICSKFEIMSLINANQHTNGVFASQDKVYYFYTTTGTYADATAFSNAMSGVYMYYELATPVETDISQYITDDNLIEVEAGGTLTFPNQNGTDYQIPVPSEETYMIDLQEAINNG